MEVDSNKTTTTVGGEEMEGEEHQLSPLDQFSFLQQSAQLILSTNPSSPSGSSSSFLLSPSTMASDSSVRSRDDDFLAHQIGLFEARMKQVENEITTQQLLNPIAALSSSIASSPTSLSPALLSSSLSSLSCQHSTLILLRHLHQAEHSPTASLSSSSSLPSPRPSDLSDLEFIRSYVSSNLYVQRYIAVIEWLEEAREAAREAREGGA